MKHVKESIKKELRALQAKAKALMSEKEDLEDKASALDNKILTLESRADKILDKIKNNPSEYIDANVFLEGVGYPARGKNLAESLRLLNDPEYMMLLRDLDLFPIKNSKKKTLESKLMRQLFSISAVKNKILGKIFNGRPDALDIIYNGYEI